MHKGSAGGDGSTRGIDMFIDIIREINGEKGYRPMKIVRIEAEINKQIVQENLLKGLVRPCGRAVPALQPRDIEDVPRIVAQMGIEPWVKAMQEHPDFDIMIGGRSYDPSPYAAYCLFKDVTTDLGLAYHMGKIMECGALCALPKSREALAIVRQDSFDIRPLDPQARCTAVSVAAHTLYEKTRPDILTGPGGDLHLESVVYEELPDDKTVRVRGARFIPTPSGEYTIKLEAARPCGFHSMFIGGFTDAILIAQIDDFLSRATAYVADNIPYDYELDFRVYGVDGTRTYGQYNGHTAAIPSWSSLPHEVGICGHVKASTQEEATNVSHMARIFCVHAPYFNQRATAGNFAMPFAPFDIPLGPVSEFCIYHTMIVNDPNEHFPIDAIALHGDNTAALSAPDEFNTNQQLGNKETSTSPTSLMPKDLTHPKSYSSSVLRGIKEPAPGHVFLADLADIIRSKNAGPYELTFDVLFPDFETASKVKKTGALTANTIAKLYDIPHDGVLVCLWWDPAFAFKATIKRPIVSGGFFERDAHGSTQHMPLMLLEIPVDP